MNYLELKAKHEKELNEFSEDNIIVILVSNKEEALTDLEELKAEYEGTEIKLVEVLPANKWGC